MKLYGNLYNRMEEGNQFCDEIKVGTGVTEYGYSDRRPYEVIEVIDQKHIIIRKLDHEHVGDGYMDNTWKLISNPDNPTYELVKRGDTWYYTNTVTWDEIKDKIDDINMQIRLCVYGGFDIDKIREKGKQTKRSKANISIGKAEYYFDFEF